MDIIQQLGPLALGSRMRRLTDRLTQDVINVYRALDIDFEPRWFPVFYVLSRQPAGVAVSIVDISKIINVTHPAVNQIASDLIKHGLVEDCKCGKDGRKRLLKLTAKGEAMLPQLEAIWHDMEIAAAGLVNDTGFDFMAAIAGLENALDQQSIDKRFFEQHKARQLDAVEIIDFTPEYRDYFKSLNWDWIEKYFTVEPEDERILSNPETEILDQGGRIFFARYRNEIVGTCALTKITDTNYEICKMGVQENLRGKQIGKKLMLRAIEVAKQLGATTMTLETNSKLQPAITLYRKVGFVLIPQSERPGGPSHYTRTDMTMKLDLQEVKAQESRTQEPHYV